MRSSIDNINPSAPSQAKRKRDEPESQAEFSHDHVAAAAARLAQRGWCPLDGPPVWAPVAFCEAMHARWGARIVALLEAERPRWFANCGEAEAEAGGDGGGGDGDGGGGGGDGGVEERPGAAAARVASAALAAEGAGIVVSAAHPCKSRWEPWEVTGPRFYASIIEAALRPMPAGLTAGRPACTGALGGHGAAPLVEHSGGGGIAEGGALPPPPPQLRALLWAASEADAAAPRLTELGWTLVPPHSDPQALHADIASSPDAPDGHPRAGVGRFHHLLWKPPPPQPPPQQPPAPQPSPVMVAGAGAVAAQVAAPCTTEVCTCTPPPYHARAPHRPTKRRVALLSTQLATLLATPLSTLHAAPSARG